MREMIDPIRHEHVSALSWHQQREEFRENAHRELRLREGLPEVIDGYYVVDGKRYGMAVSKAKGSGTGKSLPEGITDAALYAETGFTLRDEGSKEFNQEFFDLARDTAIYTQALTVKHVPETATDGLVTRTYLPEMPDEALEEEQKLDEWLQIYISQGASK